MVPASAEPVATVCSKAWGEAVDDRSEPRETYLAFKALGLNLNMQRGQPSDADLDLSNSLLTAVLPDDTVTPSGLDVRNYGGGVAGLPEARALFGEVLNAAPSEVMVGNNASLELQSHVLIWALLRGLKDSPEPWAHGSPKMIVTVPGYDRHFSLLETLGFALEPVDMTPDGPDMDAVERLVRNPAVKGILFVPTYSNPTGDTLSEANARRLAEMSTAAPDFTIFADDAYRIHHLDDEHPAPPDLLQACKEAGHPDRVFVFASTSKVTFGGAGLGFLATSEANVQYLSKLLGTQTIGPNKLEQYRHVKFLRAYPGGISGLMRDHARLIRPKFRAVQEVLEHDLGGTGLATWTKPKGGYFVSLTTSRPVADRVVALAGEAGVALTPAGATHPGGHDPNNSTLRLAPTRPPVDEVRQAMEVVAACVKLASADYDARGGRD